MPSSFLIVTINKKNSNNNNNNNNKENNVELHLTYIKLKAFLFLVALTKKTTPPARHISSFREHQGFKMVDAANNNRSVIVYEQATQTVSIKKIGELESSPILIQRTPRFKTHVEITTSDYPVRLVVTLNLRKLGSIASAKRACGRLSQIYVMATPAPDDQQKSRMVLD